MGASWGYFLDDYVERLGDAYHLSEETCNAIWAEVAEVVEPLIDKYYDPDAVASPPERTEKP